MIYVKYTDKDNPSDWAICQHQIGATIETHIIDSAGNTHPYKIPLDLKEDSHDYHIEYLTKEEVEQEIDQFKLEEEEVEQEIDILKLEETTMMYIKYTCKNSASDWFVTAYQKDDKDEIHVLDSCGNAIPERMSEDIRVDTNYWKIEYLTQEEFDLLKLELL